MEYCDRKLEQQLLSVSAYSQACTIPKDYCAIRTFTAADVKFPYYIVCTVAIICKLHLLFSETQKSKLSGLVGATVGQSIWRPYSAMKKAELLYREYTVLDGFADGLKLPTSMLNALRQPASFPL